MDIVVEAVVENPKVKRAVLQEVEAQVREDAVLCSNTSTISITSLAGSAAAAGKLLRYALLTRSMPCRWWK